MSSLAKALVIYQSQEFGNTIAEAMAEGLRAFGCDITLFNTNEGRFDVTEFPRYDCVAFGSPDYYSYIAGGLKTFMDDHYVHDVRLGLSGLKGKSYALFYSHGGGDRVKDVIVNTFRRVDTQIGEPMELYGMPDHEALERCRALGRELASIVSEK